MSKFFLDIIKDVEIIEKIKSKTDIKCLAFIIFGVLTFCFMMFRVPFYDEANAWLIAKNISFFELFQVEKYDGHLFLWHTFLMPFAKTDFFYPYSMYILNWLFCMSAVFIFLKYAPFETPVKILTMFSFPIACYFAIVARCYSLSLFALFIIAALYKKRLERPVLFSFLLVFAANTSAMAAVGAFVFGLIFIYDLIKSRIKNVFPALILFLGAVIVLIQLTGASFPEKIDPYVFLYHLKFYFQLVEREDILPIIIINALIAASSLALYILFLFLSKKRAKFFFAAVNVILLFFFLFIYSGLWWHYLFFYIYFIISFWILNSEPDSKISNIKLNKIFSVCFVTLLVLFCLKTLFIKLDGWSYLYKSQSLAIAKEFKRLNIVNANSKFYTPDSFLEKTLAFVPYFNNLTVYDMKGYKRYSLNGFKNNYLSMNKPVDLDDLANILDPNKNNYMVTSDKTRVYIKGKTNIKFKIVSVSENPYFAILQIIN